MIQFFVPVTTHSSPSRTARVIIPPGSEPASGSDSAKAGDHSPDAQRGRKRCFCSAVPNSLIGSVPSSWIIRISALEAHARAISSTATLSMSVPVPVPPCSSSNGRPEQVVLGEQPAQVPRVLGRGVDLRRARRDAVGDEVADRVAELDLVLGQRVLRRGAAGGHPRELSRPGVCARDRAGTWRAWASAPASSSSPWAPSSTSPSTRTVSGVDISTVGLILMICGVLGS